MQWFYEAVINFADYLGDALLAPLDDSSCLYWPFLLSSVVLAGVASIYWRSRGAEKSIYCRLAGLLDWKTWRHRSSLVDCKFYFLTAVIFPMILGGLSLDHSSVLDWLNRISDFTTAESSSLPSDSFMVRAAYTLVFYIAYDFGRFVSHSLLHEVPFLWEFHKVHHSAQVLTPITAFRFHPVDGIIRASCQSISTGCATWLFVNMAGVTVELYFFMGLHALLWISSLAGNLCHSSVWITYGPTWGKWFISPAHHQIHHSVDERHLGFNRGSDLAIWDRLYGTLYVPTGPRECFQYGLGAADTEAEHSIGKMLLAPFINLWRICGRRAKS